jgi:hypothetical protein
LTCPRIEAVTWAQRAASAAVGVVKTAPGVWLRLLPSRWVFGLIYRANAWGGVESRSGPASDRASTAALRGLLPGLVRDLGARTFLDIPCGDFESMHDVDLGVEAYIGADLVPAIVRRNRARWGGAGRTFVRLDIRRSALPAVDVVFCRDLLIHLSNADAAWALGNVAASGSRYLVTTTFPGLAANADILTGRYRPINLERPPFSLPPPLRLEAEHSLPAFPDRSLGVWRIAELPRAGRARRRSGAPAPPVR